jgi:hypothetical protein
MCKNSKRRVKSIYDLSAFFSLACRWGLTQFMHSSLSRLTFFLVFLLFFPFLPPLLPSFFLFPLFSYSFLIPLFSISFFSLPPFFFLYLVFFICSKLFHLHSRIRIMFFLFLPGKHLHKLFFFDVFLIRRTKTFNSLKLDN